ncbi:prepilin-type N-terminal cleavage/methylation domain-containing protein [Fusobacteria bacterium ZRK30]|nr:prepilin-type N-terminal cleavage/methylation domain-containing protein [Fusobacteria bacterium ZRK30]
MKKRGFTIIELLIVIALIGILIGIGSFSIKKQAESRGMLRVQNEIGDFFRVAAKRSLETGKKYGVDFDLVGKKIEFYREEDENGKWKDDGTRRTIEILKLPNVFEYGIKNSGTYPTEFKTNITSSGNIGNNFTLYITKSNSNSGIQGVEEVKYAISFYNGDTHVKYLHIKEYIVTTSFKVNEINTSPSANSNLEVIKNQ